MCSALIFKPSTPPEARLSLGRAELHQAKHLLEAFHFLRPADRVEAKHARLLRVSCSYVDYFSLVAQSVICLLSLVERSFERYR
jgi:hypothetical protein